jgi:hypothetical protein
MHKKKEEVIPRILAKESLNLELWLKSYEGLKLQALFWKFLEKNQKIGFSGLILDGKSVDSIHGAVHRGATGPPWTGGHCRMRELIRARPPTAPVPESSGQGAGEGKEGPVSSTAGSPRVGRQWRGVSPAASGSATVVMVMDLRSRGNERRRMLVRCDCGGVLGRLLWGQGEQRRRPAIEGEVAA